jgi:hypothetical protein
MDGGCGWHIVEQGWKAHGPGKTAVIEKKRDAYNLFKKRVKEWCYSWMTPGGVESEDEYSLSKDLLFAYLASPEVMQACDGQQYIIDQVTDFVKNYVICCVQSADSTFLRMTEKGQTNMVKNFSRIHKSARGVTVESDTISWPTYCEFASPLNSPFPPLFKFLLLNLFFYLSLILGFLSPKRPILEQDGLFNWQTS